MNLDKYVALAYGSPVGEKLRIDAFSRWDEWLRILRRSCEDPALHRNPDRILVGIVPETTVYHGPADLEDLAYRLFVEAIWVFGIELDIDPKHNKRMDTLATHRRRSKNALIRDNMFEEAWTYHRVACTYEMAELDMWLEGLYQL